MSCLPTPEARHAKEVNQQIQRDLKKHKKDLKNTKKLLLLGTGESGKTTFIKQMRILHGKPYSQAELDNFRTLVYRNIYIAVQILIDAMDRLSIQYEEAPVEAETNRILEIDYENLPDQLPPADYSYINKFWKDKGVKQCFEKRNKFQISDSAEYFLDALDRVKEDDYNPTREDIVRVRLKTVGVHEYNFNIHGQNFLMVDVGGQRGERRKWISSFENVQSVIFLTAISEYDQVLAETEEDDNRLLESLQLFETIIRYPWFKNAAIVVFFNKFDLFEKKILTSNLEEYFPYEGPRADVEEAKNYIEQMFSEVYGGRGEKLSTHFTCATDTDAMGKIFEAVKSYILSQNIKEIAGGNFS
ncbi:guanine nucleotide-binding protein (G protein), subunit alpha [Oopsacas minuta]|uniref:Guanine nucleotide-binding protein subunit alpha n=1 Tax=Oopsacas minuta TaxID=111878 RepID=A0AAV7K903_9METZ|nr:guanine nucleotide-binding protein (G protein), subunit alpha [Oopsacas minuta]